MPEYKPIYPYSLDEAIRCNERDLWLESHRENCECAKAIMQGIAKNYHDNKLDTDFAGDLIKRFGLDRVNRVLAYTVHKNMEDGRFSQENKEWAKRFLVPREKKSNSFCVNSHPGLINLFINHMRRVWQGLGLFNRSHCVSEDGGQLDYTGRIIVLKPEILKDTFKTPEDQLFLAKSGFGCSPDSSGRKVFGQFLNDGEETHFYREDFIGVIKDEYLPEWAKAKLAGTQRPGEGQDDGMTMGNG